MDSSALVKLLVREADSLAVSARAAGASLVTSALAVTEVGRVLRRSPPPARDASLVWSSVTLIEVDRHLLRRAVDVDPEHLRSLDAIHLATALTVADDLEAFVTYDRQLGRAARAAGFTVEAPGRSKR